MTGPLAERIDMYVEALELPASFRRDPVGAAAAVSTMTTTELRAAVTALCVLVSAVEHEAAEYPVEAVRAFLVTDWRRKADESPGSGE